MTETKPRKRAPAATKSAGAPPKPKAKPGEKDYDWQAEYPGEELFVFTASDGLTVGLTKLGAKRRPKPGKLAALNRQKNKGNVGIEVLWYFLELASSDNSLLIQEELEEEDYANMTRQWAEFAGIHLGE